MRISIILISLLLFLAAAPARAQLSPFPQGSVSPDQATQSLGGDEDSSGQAGRGFDSPDRDSSGATNYSPPDTPYTSNSYNNTGEVCVTCGASSRSDGDDSGNDSSDDSGDDDR